MTVYKNRFRLLFIFAHFFAATPWSMSESKLARSADATAYNILQILNQFHVHNRSALQLYRYSKCPTIIVYEVSQPREQWKYRKWTTAWNMGVSPWGTGRICLRQSLKVLGGEAAMTVSLQMWRNSDLALSPLTPNLASEESFLRPRIHKSFAADPTSFVGS